ncbi:MAG: hypothetical protein DRJ31_08735 [Candidatus Methanomethylicota archaeon]|uniref:Uncharacterized protein n=1 Tax=Thermoproteota archaeon TaxID=2056631 RepID=A0A497EL97_9CREN|nr:MAG: hypothetical protein DRJ31_08735 [Candidatus Verstraetearchaeota archaeon]
MIRFCFPYSFLLLVPQKIMRVSEEEKIFPPFPKVRVLISGIVLGYLHCLIRVPECKSSGIFKIPECNHTILCLLNSQWDYQYPSGTRMQNSGTLMEFHYITNNTRTCIPDYDTRISQRQEKNFLF